MAIPQSIVEEIRDRGDLVELVSEYVTLKRAGRSFTACCPFHDEKTPSFNVNAEEGFYKCFGCGKKGDIFSFLMDMRSWSFPESVRFLAKRLGIEIPDFERGAASESQSKIAPQLRQVALGIERCYMATLADAKAGKKAREYLKSRGLNQETIRAFNIGYAPDRWEYLLEALEDYSAANDDSSRNTSLSTEQLRQFCSQIGLLKERSGGERGHYDLFRDRIIFPIARSDGRPIAFGARVLSGGVSGGVSDIGKSESGKSENKREAPKYLNSSESPIYLKRRTLYGLPQALSSMRSERLVYLVEGYTDVLSMHQAGIHNVVASCGTAFTEEHAKVLKRLVDRVLVLFDGDDAGRKAAAACFQRFLNTGVAVKVVFLPQGEDPDSLARKSGAAGIMRMSEQLARPVVDVFLEQLLRDEGVDPAASVPEAALRGKIAAKFATTLAQVVNPVEREVLQKRGCEILGVGEEALSALIARVPKPRVQNSTRSQSAGSRSTGSQWAGPQVSKGNTSSSFGSRLPSRFNEEVPMEYLSEEIAASDFADSSSLSNAVGSHHNSSRSSSKKGSKLEKILDDYLSQLLVSVISEPSQSQLVLKTPSLLDAGLMDGGKADEKLPSSVIDFLQELSDGKYEGIMSLSNSVEEAVAEAGIERLRQLLVDHQFPAEALITEAQRQCATGGTRHDVVVADLNRVTKRSSLSKEIELLKTAERQASSVEELQEILQKKLELRKQLDAVSGESH